VLFAHREAYYTHDASQINHAEIIVAKQRRGPTGTAKVYYDPLTCTFRSHSFDADPVDEDDIPAFDDPIPSKATYSIFDTAEPLTERRPA
jgi:hypothetical protein